MSSELAALSHQFAETVAQVGQAIVAVNVRRRFPASGIHWQSGIVVTADHGMRREESLTVTLADGRGVRATLLGRDGRMDLAVLRLETTDFPTVVKADVEELRVGNLVLAIARSTDASASASLGVISTIETSGRGRPESLVRPALLMYPGFSGGALVNVAGQVIGMNTSGPHRTSFTIPAAVIDRIVTQLLQDGRITRGYLGVGMQTVRLPDTTRQSLNLSNSSGVIIVSVDPGAPADQAGLLLGDVIVTIEGDPVEEVSEIQEILAEQSAGQSMTLQMVRGGTLISVTVVIGERRDRCC
jgi:serine protease DegQ